MKLLLLRTTLLTACLALRLAAADTPGPSPASTSTAPLDDQKKLEEAIRLRLAEHALKKATKAAPPAATATPPSGSPANPAGTPPAAADAQSAAPKDEPTTLLPPVEVSQSRITELAIKQHEMDVQIAREKRNTTPTGLDNSLNDPGVSHTLSIFGGSSSEDRARLAQERVSLLEAEKDLMEEIATARTKEERDDLEKQLNELRTMRRELERAPKDERK